MAEDKLCECGCGQPAPLSDRTDAGRGAVRGKPLRFIVGHSRRGRRRARYEERACGYETPCWVWLLAPNRRTGYGYETKDGKHELAHRAVYEALRGPIPEGMQLDHLCRNRRCVNPDHLEPVTNAENARRGAQTKLTPADVQWARISELSNAEVARRLGVSDGHISRIRSRQTWAA